VARLPLTLTGGVVTDADRRAQFSLGLLASGQMCDGIRAPDHSLGIRRAATNLFRRGQCDATTDTTMTAGATRVVDATVPAPFSPQSIKVTTDGTSAAQGIVLDSATGQAAAAATNGVAAVYVKGVIGQQYDVTLRWQTTLPATVIGVATTIVATGGWQLVSAPATAVPVGQVGDQVRVQVKINGTRAESFWVAHAMLEKGQSVVSPYVATSGGATATRAAGRVQAPATLLNTATFWAAARVRVGWAATDDQYGGGGNGPQIFLWGTPGASEYASLFYREGDNAWRMRVGDTVAARSEALIAGTHTAGATVTVVGALVGSAPWISLNGGAFVKAAAWPVVPPTSLFDIGNNGGASQVNGEVLWFACGTGTLTDADAARIHAKLAGGTEPTIGELNLLGLGATAVVRGYA
jgi:hypothetical protein